MRSTKIVLATVLVLIGLPVVLVVTETVSYHVRNRSNGSIVSSGQKREYLLHVPKSYDRTQPTPLVISMHGAAMWPAAQKETSQWNARADAEGFIVVYPSAETDGGPRAWNVHPGRGLMTDVRFISDLIDTLRAAYNIDPARIYANGLSNGGGMSFVLSCTLSDRIAAVGTVAAAQTLPFSWCKDSTPVPMIAFQGTADPVVPYRGGKSWVAPMEFPSVTRWAADWARRNRCGAKPVDSLIARDVTRREYADCADDRAVVLYTIQGGGHIWPGGRAMPEWILGPDSRSIDATSRMWAFFREHRRQTEFHLVRPGVLAIEHVTVLPMTRDTALLDHTVLVRDDRIVWLGRSSDARVPPGARTVDGAGRFLIPGLADMHVHVRSTQHLSQFVAAGVTTVRNMNGGPEHVAWRERVAAGTLAGPTMFTAGPPLGQYRVNPDPRFVGLKTTADAERVVREQAAAGYDMIKVIQRINARVYEHLVKVARAARMPVVGHVIPGIGLERSLLAGQVSIEHIDGLRNRSRVASLLGANEKGFDEDARAIARSGAWAGTIASSRTGGCEPPTDIVRRSIASLRRAKVKMLAGSDAGIGPVQPSSALHCELATLVAAGLTPYEALATATVNAGAFARMHLKRAQVPFGTVVPGARADLVLLAADPRADIRAVAKPVGVVLRGVWLPGR